MKDAGHYHPRLLIIFALSINDIFRMRFDLVYKKVLDGAREPVVFIAGSIGITPYRSLILHCATSKEKAPSSIRLLYADDAGQYAFRPELDEIASKNHFIQLDFITSSKLPSRISECVHEAGNNVLYFISGSGKMVQSLKKSLLQHGSKNGT